MKRKLLFLLFIPLAIAALSLPSESTAKPESSTDPTVIQCGKWLQNCAQAANAYYTGCRAGGGGDSECALLAEANFDTCLESLYNAGCNTFPSDCYTIDVRQPYAKSCQTQP